MRWILWTLAGLGLLVFAALVAGGVVTVAWILAGYGPPPWMHDPNADIP